MVDRELSGASLVASNGAGRWMSTLPLAKVMDMLLDTICVVDVEGRFVYVSASCERLFGYKPEELIGRNMIDLVHPDDRDRTLAAVDDIMDGQSKPHFENRYVRKDGRVVDVMWSARWSQDDGVRMAVARDVTELKRAEQLKSALYQISEAAHAVESQDELYRHIHQIIEGLLPADNFLVALHDPATDMLSFPYFVSEREKTSAPRPVESCALLAGVIRDGRAVLASAEGQIEFPLATEREHEGGASWLGVPLSSQNGIMGVLAVRATTGGRRYTEEDKELLQFVSTQIATVIERKQAESQLRHMAGHDALTDLPNRALFQDRFDMALERARRVNEHLALLYLDLDDFKQVNDSFGHTVGDQLLREVAQRLVQCVRASDTVGRMGGDEFTVLLTNIGASDCAEVVADKIRGAIAEPFELDGWALSISASMGMAVYPEHGVDGERLLRRADADMYATKQVDTRAHR